ncbi:MAG: radical SAM protein [Methanothrix sp.]
MVTLERMARLADECRFDSLGQETGSNTTLDGLAAVDPGKLQALGEGTRHDVCASTYSPRSSPLPGICHAFTQDGRCVSLFKTLYTNRCTHQCGYCTNAAGCKSRPGSFSYTPEELAGITLSLYRANYIEGLFLSSGAGRDEDRTMEKMIDTARLLRRKFSFPGYIHLKILPGASESHIQEAMTLADRVSINLEAASAAHMSEICSTKSYESDILQRQRYINRFMKKRPSGAEEKVVPAGQTTQLVVGAAGESDEEIFQRVVYEYEEIDVKRAYYSAFSPQPGTLLEDRVAQPIWRERRLYQMDWLYRVYHFKPEEIRLAFDGSGFLHNSDPKAIIAGGFSDMPLDPNVASYQQLIRVPGIGPVSAKRILAWRKRQPLLAKRQLAALGVRIKSASPYLKINGWRDSTLEMWLD